MKRKALITATAILLVSVMCLATASYAWFTGGGSVGIEQFKFTVGGNDANVLLAAADMNDKYSAETWSPTLSLGDWSNGKGIVPLTDELNDEPSLTAVSTTNGKTFFGTDYASGIWTSREINSTDSYLLLSFWVKPEEVGDVVMKVALGDGNDEKFEQSVKFGYAATTGDIGNVTSVNDLTTYAFSADDADRYQSVNAINAKAVKNLSDLFVPYVDNSDPENPVTSGGFATAKDQVALPFANGFKLSFADSDPVTDGDQIKPQLVTIAIWLEGMDKNCSGTWSIKNQAVTVSFTKVVSE